MQTLYLTKKEAGIIFDLLDPALRKRPSSWADVVRIMNEQEGNNRSVEGIKSYWNKEVKTLLISLFPDIKIVPGEDEDEDA